jgi:shikimate kinase
MAQRSSARTELDALWAARAPLYAQAALHVDTSSHDIDGVVRIVADAVKATEAEVASA